MEDPGDRTGRTPDNTDMIGRTIGHYRILERIGAGGMGEVYKAEDTQLSRPVALKFLPLELTRDSTARRRLVLEARAASALDHPNICGVHEIGETADGRMFICMVHYDGETLKDRLARGSMSFEEILSVAIQTAQGLAGAHQAGVVHRDIKPANIMITRTGDVKILDFGLAKLSGHTHTTESEGTAGTTAYMSPEQARGLPVDARTDIWSFGVVLYEMLTGRNPFAAPYTKATVHTILNETPAPVTDVRPDTPPELIRIVVATLTRPPEQRAPSMAGVLDQLIDYRNSRDGVASDTLRRTAARMTRRQGWQLATLLLLLAAAAGYLVITRLTAPPTAEPYSSGEPAAARKPKIFVEPVKIASPVGDAHNLSDILTFLLEVDLFQSRYLSVIKEPEGATHRVRVMYMEGSACRLQAAILDATTQEYIASAQVELAEPADPQDLIDALTPKIKEALQFSPESIAGDIDTALRDVTTSSREALRLYIEADKLYASGRFTESNARLEQATALDSEFAMAYARMSVNYGHLRELENDRRYMQKALAFKARLTPRERFNLELLYSKFTEVNYLKRADLGRRFDALYPNDAGIKRLVGGIYRNAEDWPEAGRWFRGAAVADPTDHLAVLNLAEIDIRQGLAGSARTLLVRNRPLFKDPMPYQGRLAWTYLLENQYQQARQELMQCLDLPREKSWLHVRLAAVENLCGRPGEAERILRERIRHADPDQRLMGHYVLAEFLIGRGRYTESAQVIDAGLREAEALGENAIRVDLALLAAYLELRRDNAAGALRHAESAGIAAPALLDPEYDALALHVQGLAFLAQGRAEAAADIARRLQALETATGMSKLRRHYYHLSAAMALHRGDPRRAAALIELALPLLDWTPDVRFFGSPSLYLPLLAEAYRAGGRVDRAVGALTRLRDSAASRLNTSDSYALALLNLGRCARQQGKAQDARRHFGRFLDVWKDADSDRPELKEAAAGRRP